jgi:hypothetical protein
MSPTPVRECAEVRPRSLGEILDDGWRLALADLPLHLALAGLFLVVCAVATNMLLTQPPGTGAFALAWPLAAAILVPLTGLGSGACQEAFHIWTEGDRPTVGRCLRATVRRALNHMAAQVPGLVLAASAAAWLLGPALPMWARWLGMAVTVLIGLPVWLLGITRHAVLAAGQKNLTKAWRHSSQASGRHPLKATVLLASRLAFLFFAVFNIHLFSLFGLWCAEALGGFDVALPRLVCSFANPVYVLALLWLAWWLLTPFMEAAAYLFYVDARTRHEGLDLWFRVEQYFPAVDKTRAGALLLAVAAALLACPAARGDEKLDGVRSVRLDIERIAREIKVANPYPGSQRWTKRLEAIGRRLDPEGNADKGRSRWYFQSIANFGKQDRTQALQTLDSVAARLAAVEDGLARPQQAPRSCSNGENVPSRDYIKGLVPQGEGKSAAPKKDRPREQEPKQGKEAIKRDDAADLRPPHATGPGVLGPVGLGGLGKVVLVFFLVLLVVVVLAVLVIAVRHWMLNRVPDATPVSGVREPTATDYLDEPDKQSVSNLWRKADDLAGAGRFLEALRTLYLGVLALLHQAALIRYERPRTNGEYADQLRARRALHQPFVQLTGLFEIKWYGERACQEADYNTCRTFAERLREESSQRSEGER